jgi:hypothetical protein
MIQDIERRIPHTHSLGTKHFCAGSDLAIDCSDLTLDLSSFLPVDICILPDAVEGALHERASQLTSVTAPWIHLSALNVPGFCLRSIATLAKKTS